MRLAPIRNAVRAELVAVFAMTLALIGCAPPAVGTAPEPEVIQQPTHHQSHPRHHKGHSGPKESHEKSDLPKVASGIPDKVAKVLSHIDKFQRAPEGYVGGRVFRNLGRDDEERLPRTDAKGKAITYQEWDVNPKKPGVNRGAERLITGSDGKAYYTKDHYRTFKKVR